MLANPGNPSIKSLKQKGKKMGKKIPLESFGRALGSRWKGMEAQEPNHLSAAATHLFGRTYSPHVGILLQAKLNPYPMRSIH
jgi:hypothetical protein